MGDCKTGCSCKKQAEAKDVDTKVRKKVHHFTEMVAHRTLHASGDQPWRCRMCEDFGKHSYEEIVTHLHGIHGYNMEEANIDKSEGVIYCPVKEDQSAAAQA